MSRKLIAVFLLVTGLATQAAHGSEAAIRQAFQSRITELTVESVNRSPMPGLYEVVANGQIFYVDEKANFVIRGVLFDARTPAMRNITGARSAELAAQVLRKSTDNAIKRVRGNGRRVVYTFEDPNCGFCKELQKELLKVTDITIYTFLWPILSPDSMEKSKAVWCAKDRAKAWDELMSRGVTPQDGTQCDTPIAKNMELARRFGAQGTPAVYLADGRSVGGFLAADKLEEALRAATSK
ncbi:MAG: DsbC family protein [Betaproteobacteria bacterium]|nr:DsbC family protein [Betaproteobacteria bacterium]